MPVSSHFKKSLVMTWPLMEKFNESSVIVLFKTIQLNFRGAVFRIEPSRKDNQLPYATLYFPTVPLSKGLKLIIWSLLRRQTSVPLQPCTWCAGRDDVS